MLEILCQQAIEIVKETGKFIASHHGKVSDTDIEVKSLNSLVSYVDKEAEEILVKGLRRILPDAVFLTEEETIENKSGDWQWIIDPLDGTTNFLHSVPVFSVSVALRHKNETLIGLVYDVMHDDLYYAIKEKGAFLNENRIHVSDRDTSDALLATGFPYYDFSLLDEYLLVLKELIQKTRGLRRLGSAALDLAYLASGKFDLFYEHGLNPWDVAAGALLVKEAGGIVSNFKNKPDYLFTRQIVAGTPKVHNDNIELIIQHLGKGK